MEKTFLTELNDESITGVAYKNVSLKKTLIARLANTGNSTIAELCDELKLSAPKVNNLLGDLMQDGWVQEYGKVDSTGGRRANLYGLAPNSGFFIGVDVRKFHLNIGLLDLQKNLVKVTERHPYSLTNTPESLDELCAFINDFIAGTAIPRDKILGMGINLSGRVNFATGYSYSFFYFNEEPLSKIIETRLGIRVFLENDSKAMAYGEFCAGAVNGEKDVLFLNLDHGIGLGIIVNGQLYYGKSGFSGEFGHIPLFKNEIICHCGKKGCLETEASGWALTRLFEEKLREGSSSVLTSGKHDPLEIQLEDIIQAAISDDMLAIELIGVIGENLGKGIALLINLFNPELVILGGSLADTGEYIRLPIKSAINKYSLSLVNNDTQLKMSRLGDRAGVIGSCLLVRNRILSIA